MCGRYFYVYLHTGGGVVMSELQTLAECAGLLGMTYGKLRCLRHRFPDVFPESKGTKRAGTIQSPVYVFEEIETWYKNHKPIRKARVMTVKPKAVERTRFDNRLAMQFICREMVGL